MDPRWSQPPPGWQPRPRLPYQAWQAAGPSGLLKASGVLLLIGAILSAVMAGFILLMALFFGVFIGALASEAGAGFGPGGIIAGFYGVFGLALLAGSICGFIAWRKVPGDLESAFVWGLVGTILQGVNIFSLLGTIFAKTCPEAEAAAAQRHQAWAQPPQSP